MQARCQGSSAASRHAGPRQHGVQQHVAAGGQVLGPTFDYTHRLIDFALAAEGEGPLGLAGQRLGLGDEAKGDQPVGAGERQPPLVAGASRAARRRAASAWA